MNDRPHDDALLALLYDELPPGEADALREKLAAESPESLDRLTQWQAIRDVVAELPELEPDPQIHYDIIREARRAVAADEKPSRLWAWLEQLTLMPALAGLLLVVLAAGLTVRMTTDLEQADDSALAPAGTARPAGSAAATGEKKKSAAPVKKDTETVAGLDRPADRADQEVASKAAEDKSPTAATKAAPPVPQVEAEPAPEGDARGGLLDGINGKAGLEEAAKPIEAKGAASKGAAAKGAAAKGAAAKGAGRAAGEKQALAAARESASKKSKARPRKSRREAPPKVPVAKGRKSLDGLNFGDAAPQAPAAEPAPPEPAPDPAPAQAAAANAPVDDLFAGAAVTEAKAAEDSERREELGDTRSGDANRDRGRAATRQPARAEAAPGEPAANAPAGERVRNYAPPPPAPATDADEIAVLGAGKAGEAEEAVAVQADSHIVPLGGDADAPADAPDDAAGDTEQRTGGADHLSRARLLRARGLHREAVGEFEAFLSQSRGSSGLDRVWFEAAESYRALGQEQRALQLYRLVAGGETTYADRARDRIASITGQNAGPGKAAGQAAPARARPAAAPQEADALESRE